MNVKISSEELYPYWSPDKEDGNVVRVPWYIWLLFRVISPIAFWLNDKMTDAFEEE